MRDVKFLKEPGFVFDLFFLFTLHFNKEYCLSEFINYNKSSEDTDYYSNVLNGFSPISDELLLFFHLMDNKKCFMTQKYYEPYKSEFLSGSYNLSTVQDALTNHEQVAENVLLFYFKDIDEETLSKCKTSMCTINTLIKGSDYNGDIKSALYSFFIDPASVIRKLSYELMEKEFSLSQKYDNEFRRLNALRENFDFDSLTENLKCCKTQSVDTGAFNTVAISFSLYHKNFVKTHYYADSVLMLLGADYIDYVGYLTVQNRTPELGAFGNAISEANRVAVLNLILQKGEITIKDLEQEFGFTGTNAYYHLSLMIKAGMLKTRNSGRTVLYSINKNYFQTLCDMLSKYYKE